MKTKLKMVGPAAVLSLVLAAPVHGQAAFDPADRAQGLIDLGVRIQGIYDALAERLAARGFTAAAERVAAIGEAVRQRVLERAAVLCPPTTPGCPGG
jgi:hypothetical protein